MHCVDKIFFVDGPTRTAIYSYFEAPGSEYEFVNILRSLGIDSQRAGTTTLFDVRACQDT
jgi:hypothetical protein